MGVSMTDFDDRKAWSPGSSGFLTVHDICGGEATVGVFYHRVGIVDIYQQGDEKFHHRTMLRAVGSSGKIHERSWKRRWGRRTLPTLCRQFLEDLHGEAQ